VVGETYRSETFQPTQVVQISVACPTLRDRLYFLQMYKYTENIKILNFEVLSSQYISEIGNKKLANVLSKHHQGFAMLSSSETWEVSLSKLVSKVSGVSLSKLSAGAS